MGADVMKVVQGDKNAVTSTFAGDGAYTSARRPPSIRLKLSRLKKWRPPPPT